jgi:hypothetical protein
MNDHETYLLLAAKRISEPLTMNEEAELEAHLAACPDCRAFAAGLRRDDIRLRAALVPVAVAPRVRERVLAEVSGSRNRAAGRLILLLAATLGLGIIGWPLVVGGSPDPVPSAAPTPSLATVATPSPPTPSLAVSATASPSISSEPTTAVPSPSATPVGVGQSVNASYTYSDTAPRRAAISARIVDGRPEGAWSRRIPPTGASQVWAGTITCLVIVGQDAWMAGPVTETTEDRPDQAVFILAHDGGPEGDGDTVTMWLNTHGETLELLEGWCRDRYIPGDRYPVTSGDVTIEGG